MRYIRYAFLAALAICLVLVAIANRQSVTLKLFPDGMPDVVTGVIGGDLVVQLPLFIVIFLSIVAGLLIGFAWEWLREHKHRAEARSRGREVGQLQREVSRLKDEKNEGKDEILALLDNATAR
jgi:uncharacterized integral membrane protein